MSQTGTPKDAFASHVVAAAARLAADPAGAEQDARRLLQRAPQDPRLIFRSPVPAVLNVCVGDDRNRAFATGIS